MDSAPNGSASGNIEGIKSGEINNISDDIAEMEMSPVTILPHEVIEKLAELDLELSEGKSKLKTAGDYELPKIPIQTVLFAITYNLI